MKNLKILKSFLISFFVLAVFSVPFFVLAANDVQITDNTNFELLTSDTSVSVTIVASSGGQVTNFDVESNYIDITLDNSSTVTFNTNNASRYIKITKQSGSSSYTVSPSCPTNSVTLAGTGAQVILRLQIQTTNPCSVTPPHGGGGSSGGGSINGLCGVANNTSYSSVPTTNLCSVGTPSAVTGSGPWTWTCSGFYGGLSNTCSAIKIPILSAPITSTCSEYTTVTTCAPYLTKYIKLGAVNDSVEVKKLQTFLIKYEGFSNLTVTGIYDQTTYNAVKVFQSRYVKDILIPWGSSNPTGYVYTTTIKKINEIYCQKNPPTSTTLSTCTQPATPQACVPYLTKYIKLGAVNDSVEVKKLQSFLNKYEDFALAVDGVYGPASFSAVKKFQTKYAKDILVPWNTTKPSGWVYKTTVKKINELYCKYIKQ